MRTKRKRIKRESWVCYIFVGLMAFACFLPLWITFSVSISNEADVVKNGFSLFPKNPNLNTYIYIISNKGIMLARAFGVSIATAFAGTLFSLTVMTCFAYAVAQKKEVFRFANVLSFFAWFTTVFSGGILPWYILTTKYYGLQNNMFALFIPAGMNVFFIFILKSNFKAIPEELVEAAKIDGASHVKIFFIIAIPLAKVGLVTIILFTALQYWNDFHLSLYLITKTDLYTVQKLLYNMMANISALLSRSDMVSASAHVTIPTNTARMAMTMLTVIPVVMFYPFALKYFVKGVTIGAVKG